MNRAAALHRVADESFDVCIIGGGATGAGCALDAALRGLRVVLMERDDFAAHTSSKSTKLIHGGVRYLEEAVKQLSWAQFQMVRKALAERRTLLRNAPHLTRPLALLTPCYSAWEALYLSVGLKLYDWLAGTQRLAPSRWLSRHRALAELPQLRETLHSAVSYWDGQLDDARYALALVQSAAEAGAVVLNHAEALSFTQTPAGTLQALQAEDRLTGTPLEIRARVFVNATGPFADRVRKMANPAVPERLRVSRGSHVVLPREVLPGETAILVPRTDDGRVLFLIPYQHRVLVGTTDLDDTISDAPLPWESERRYLLEYVNRYLRTPVTEAAIQGGFTGQRPLIQGTAQVASKSLVRDHEVERDPRSGLISILGGKWTTYRLMASDTIDAVMEDLPGAFRTCQTETHRLAGAEGYHDTYGATLAQTHGLTPEVGQHLARRYGTRAARVIDLMQADPTLREPLLAEEPFLRAEVVYAIRYEMACTADDVLFRRLGLGLFQTEATERARPLIETLLQHERARVPA